MNNGIVTMLLVQLESWPAHPHAAVEFVGCCWGEKSFPIRRLLACGRLPEPLIAWNDLSSTRSPKGHKSADILPFTNVRPASAGRAKSPLSAS